MARRHCWWIVIVLIGVWGAWAPDARAGQLSALVSPGALARAHAKSGDSARISGYLGGSDRIDRAITDFSMIYADQCEKDFAVFKRAIRTGKIPAEIEFQPA